MPGADMNGTSFQMYLSGVSVLAMVTAFGSPDPNAYWDPEAGYDGDEWGFKDDAGSTFKVYARFGQLRVGARGPEGVEAFGAWLYEKLEIAGPTPKLATHWISPIGSIVQLGGAS